MGEAAVMDPIHLAHLQDQKMQNENDLNEYNQNRADGSFLLQKKPERMGDWSGQPRAIL